MEDGWVKIHRKLLNSRYGKSIELLGLWTYLILRANHAQKFFTSKGVKLCPGQLATGRKQIAKDLGINEHKVDRLLKKLEIEQQIEQQTFNKYRIISIVNWSSYQKSEHVVEQQVSNNRATSEQQVSTIQECKNKRIKEKKGARRNAEEILDYYLTKNLVDHRKNTHLIAEVEKALGKRKNYTADEIMEAIANLDHIYNSPEFLWSTKWGILELLNQSNATKFYPGEFDPDRFPRNRGHESTNTEKKLMDELGSFFSFEKGSMKAAE
ncbi:MAG: hypothetical protein KJO73_09105 [Croceitalea sp.]|nr:hypothetical protein [Croceitalea sp.]